MPMAVTNQLFGTLIAALFSPEILCTALIKAAVNENRNNFRTHGNLTFCLLITKSP